VIECAWRQSIWIQKGKLIDYHKDQWITHPPAPFTSIDKQARGLIDSQLIAVWWAATRTQHQLPALAMQPISLPYYVAFIDEDCPKSSTCVGEVCIQLCMSDYPSCLCTEVNYYDYHHLVTSAFEQGSRPSLAISTKTKFAVMQRSSALLAIDHLEKHCPADGHSDVAWFGCGVS